MPLSVVKSVLMLRQAHVRAQLDIARLLLSYKGRSKRLLLVIAYVHDISALI